MTAGGQFTHHVVLVDYSAELFSPMGFEAERLAAVGASWEVHACRSAAEVLEEDGFVLVLAGAIAEHQPSSAEELRILRDEVDRDKLYI